MKKKILKNIVSLAALFLMIMPMLLVASSANATALGPQDLWGKQLDSTGKPTGANIDVSTQTGLGAADPRVVVANVIRVVLGFLGIIAVIIIVIGGFEWMTSGGSDAKAKEGKTRIVNGVIGLLIILAAYGIANFAIGAVLSTTAA